MQGRRGGVERGEVSEGNGEKAKRGREGVKARGVKKSERNRGKKGTR